MGNQAQAECGLQDQSFIPERAIMELGTENITPSNAVAGEEVDFTVAARAHDAEGDASNLVPRSSDTARTAENWLTHQVDRLRATQEQALSDVRQYVRDQPFKAVGIAIAAGWLYDRIRG
jgi:ElaB/YqjD/DUF883 family membrane-anchored ribosome-binding protein